GSSVNRFLLEGIARAGQGEPFIVTRPDEASEQVAKFRDYISAPLLTHIAVDFGGLGVYDVEPVSIPDVLADRPAVVFGKWKGEARGTITVRGQTGTGEYRQEFEVAGTKPIEGTGALAYLWARSRIASLSDYNQLERDDERVKAVTNLGLTYNLLTAYTSFVAVDNIVRNAGGDQQHVKQPVALPQGVENTAVGAAVPTVPEPETWALMIMAGAMIAYKAYRARKAQCA
ncbi:MAG TPA: PEP-CTERM sorting domain-containing protein, partial [Chthoniobacterales bacterium]|nr:PEP-CTERM sorting domain-containing protein [Chthoniobacterales bacterium]